MGIDKEDKNFFINAMKDVKPLKKSNIIIQKTTPTKVDVITNKNIKTAGISLTTTSNYQSNDLLFYTKPGVQEKTIKQTIKKMSQGKMPLPPCLDLHGQKVNEALQSLTKFISYHQDKKYIQIIHGKGYNSENNKPILKNLTDSFLKQEPSVLSFRSCHINNGGTGSVIVLLKNNTKVKKPY